MASEQFDRDLAAAELRLAVCEAIEKYARHIHVTHGSFIIDIADRTVVHFETQIKHRIERRAS